MTDTLERQKKFFVASVAEAKAKEVHRLKKLQNAKNKQEEAMLGARFEKERLLDQTKIQQLASDLAIMKQKAASGDLQSVQEIRKARPSSGKSRDDFLPNRFVGLEKHEQVVFQTDIIGKFNRHDRRFEARQNRATFNPVEEQRKLQLLDSKRQLLTQLVNIQAAEMNAAGMSTYRHGHGRGNSSIGRSNAQTYKHGSMSDASSISGSSSASYATFASNGRGAVPNTAPRKPVPQLRLPRLTEK